jgi:hypothetical protein
VNIRCRLRRSGIVEPQHPISGLVVIYSSAAAYITPHGADLQLLILIMTLLYDIGVTVDEREFGFTGIKQPRLFDVIDFWDCFSQPIHSAAMDTCKLLYV